WRTGIGCRPSPKAKARAAGPGEEERIATSMTDGTAGRIDAALTGGKLTRLGSQYPEPRRRGGGRRTAHGMTELVDGRSRKAEAQPSMCFNAGEYRLSIESLVTPHHLIF
ncbi:hypothetical protein MLD52_22585, partial [Puniceicoccaceae bacterium K14]|nr:hypothetical protein [Puniceicoccaceae bacterium K14]